MLQSLSKFGIALTSSSAEIIYAGDYLGKKLTITHGYDFTKAVECDQNWKAYHLKILAYLKTLSDVEAQSIYSKIDHQDWHWDWMSKTYSTKTDSNYEWFFLDIDGSIEAACLIYFPKNSFLNPTEQIFYIEFIAVAPWNRYSPLETKRYFGLGSFILLRSIGYLAKKYNHSGRFSLHSLAQAEMFYVNKLKMEHIGLNDKPQLKYFELPEHAITSILGEVA